MNNPSQVFSTYQAFSIANMVLFGFAMAGVLVIVWIGWLRTRQIGYLVLAAWALASMASMAISYFPISAFAGNPGGYGAAQKLMMWLHLLRVIVTSILLLTGLGLLVFRESRRSRPGA